MAFNFRKAGGLLGGMMQPDDEQQPGGMGGLLGSLLGKTAAGAAGPFTPPAGIPELPQSAPPPDAAPAKPASFWEGGDKFGWRDGVGGALAVLGDAFAQQSGGTPSAVSMLSKGRLAKLEANKAAAQTAQVLADLKAQGYSDGEARLMALDPKSIGTNMAGRTGAYSLGKGDVRYNGNRQVAERPDSFENPVGDRFNSFANGDIKQFYREESPVYQNVDGLGVYGMDRHKAGLWGTEGGGSPSAAGAPSAGQRQTYTDPTTGETYELTGTNRNDPNAWQKVGGGGGNATGGFQPGAPSRFRR